VRLFSRRGYIQPKHQYEEGKLGAAWGAALLIDDTGGRVLDSKVYRGLDVAALPTYGMGGCDDGGMNRADGVTLEWTFIKGMGRCLQIYVLNLCRLMNHRWLEEEKK